MKKQCKVKYSHWKDRISFFCSIIFFMLNLCWNCLANSICYCGKSYFVFPVFPDASPGFSWVEFYSFLFFILSRVLFSIFLFFFFWYLWDLSRLFVRINFASRCRITSIFNRASFTLLGAQVYILWRFLITNFGVLQLIVLINALNDSDSKTKE